MKIKYFIGFFSGLLLLCSCQFEKVPKKKSSPIVNQENNVPTVPDETITIDIFDKEPLRDEKVYIATVRGGDQVSIEITGKYTKPSFSEIYTKRSASTWRMQICHIPIEPLPPGHIPKSFSQCNWYNKRGVCDSLFRDYTGTVDEEIVFDDSFNYPKISYFIGDKEYFLSTNNSNDKNILKVDIEVTKELVQASSNLFLKVYPDNLDTKTKIGFLSFNKCEGQGVDSFDPHISTSSSEVSNTRTLNYLLSAKLKYSE